MKTFVTDKKSKYVEAFQRDGKYILKIYTKKVAIMHKKGYKAWGEEYWDSFEKAFDTPEQANRYFLGIKKNNPTLKAM